MSEQIEAMKKIPVSGVVHLVSVAVPQNEKLCRSRRPFPWLLGQGRVPVQVRVSPNPALRCL